MLQLRTRVDGREFLLDLASSTEVRLGRGVDNDLILPDPSVSRRHAVVRRYGEDWVIRDLGSTNGLLLNGTPVATARVRAGDRLGVGAVEVEVADARPTDPMELDDPPETASGAVSEPLELEAGEPPREAELDRHTVVRPVVEALAEHGLEPRITRPLPADAPAEVPPALGFDDRALQSLTRLAGLLLTAEGEEEVLQHLMQVTFEALSVDRGFILLVPTGEEEGSEGRENGDGSGSGLVRLDLEPRLARFGERLETRPREIPVSGTILAKVRRERVALLTYDALTDRRFAPGESILKFSIRAAMCVPLWSGRDIVGVIQVDTPCHPGAFGQRDLDFLVALANYGALAVERIRWAASAERERRLRGRLQRYHSPEVIEEVLAREEPVADETASGLGSLQRSLKRAEVTVLFADLAGFTALAENLPAERLAALLETYFDRSVDAIFGHGGTLDKFMGDCVMAFFGAPLPRPDHALAGVRAALAMRTSLEEHNRRAETTRMPPLHARIALNSGPVVVGDIGSRRRVDYSVIGNTVNIASRLEEGLAQPGEIVIGEDTLHQLDGRIETEPLGEHLLRGLRHKVGVYRVLRELDRKDFEEDPLALA